MDLSDKIYGLAAKIRDLRQHVLTEEGTKTSFILPFLQMLGYDTSDPRIVVPEYIADIGTKKGEKVDYAIRRNGEVIFLIEAKCAGAPLDSSKASQLHRYFHNTPSARIAILTNGICYEFYSDLDKQNIMDEKPFMVFDFEAIEDALIHELKKLESDKFDVDIALSAAQDLKYLRQIKQIISSELTNPSDTIVRYFVSKIYDGQIRANVIDSFRPKIAQAFEHYINDVLMDRIKGVARTTVYGTTPSNEESEQSQDDPSSDDGIITTQEEIEGYFIVKSILREFIDPSRIYMRDGKSYCAIILDDNNRKTICRLHFNSSKIKYVGTFDSEKKETRHRIDSLNDLYKLADIFKTTVSFYTSDT